jgi:hypothetical protein
MLNMNTICGNLVLACDAGPLWRKRIEKDAATLYVPTKQTKYAAPVGDDGLSVTLAGIAILALVILRRAMR